MISLLPARLGLLQHRNACPRTAENVLCAPTRTGPPWTSDTSGRRNRTRPPRAHTPWPPSSRSVCRPRLAAWLPPPTASWSDIPCFGKADHQFIVGLRLHRVAKVAQALLLPQAYSGKMPKGWVPGEKTFRKEASARLRPVAQCTGASAGTVPRQSGPPGEIHARRRE